MKHSIKKLALSLLTVLLVALTVQPSFAAYCANSSGGWRAVNSYADCTADETYSDAQPVPTVAQIQAAKWGAIKAERDRRVESGGYNVGGKWLASDQLSRTQQLGLTIMGANIPANLQWKTMDGTFVTMTPTLAQQIFAAAAASDQAIFSYAETLKAEMESSVDPANFNIMTGWPLIYGE